MTESSDRLIGEAGVISLTSLKRSTIRRLLSAPDSDFPKPIQLTPGRIAWSEASVREWIARKVAVHQARSEAEVVARIFPEGSPLARMRAIFDRAAGGSFFAIIPAEQPLAENPFAGAIMLAGFGSRAEIGAFRDRLAELFSAQREALFAMPFDNDPAWIQWCVDYLDAVAGRVTPEQVDRPGVRVGALVRHNIELEAKEEPIPSPAESFHAAVQAGLARFEERTRRNCDAGKFGGRNAGDQ
jgi:predicted DNA-binding transcriptional regulator AlpA